MYAIVKTGGKQIHAQKDGIVIVEKIDGEPGTKIELDEVVMLHDGTNVTVGTPLVKGAKVTAEIVKQGKATKKELSDLAAEIDVLTDAQE